jgi:uncharacterized small protein (DUF1192 family)
MEEIKLALKNLWKAVVKHLLSKTTLDEKIAAKAKEIDELDEEKPKKTKTKKQK